MTRRIGAVTVMVVSLWATQRAEAQVLGVFRWQLLPYCNVLTLTVTQQGAQFLADGLDDQCGGGASPAAVRGLAFQKPSGAIGFGLTLVSTPGATPVHVDAEITLPSYSGTWTDSSGHSGTFSFAVPGGGTPVPRVGLGSGAIADGSITASKLAADAVTTTAVADGAITEAKLAPGVGGSGDITSVVAGPGLQGGATSGAAVLSVAFAGTGAATTAARSDHTHAAPPTFTFQCTSTFVTSNVSASATFDIEIPACPATYTVTGAGCRTPGFNQATWAINGLYQASAGSPIGTFCSGTNTTAGTISVQGTASCCRVVTVP